MSEDINLKKIKERTEGTYFGNEELFLDLFGLNDGNGNLEHGVWESYVPCLPLSLQQCALTQDLHNSHPMSCSFGTDENYSPISGSSIASGFDPSEASIENLHFQNTEILSCVALERENKDFEEDLLLEDILNDSSISDLEIGDSCWKELTKEFGLGKDSSRNEWLDSSHLVNVKKGFTLNFDPTSNQAHQYINSKLKPNLSMDNYFTDAFRPAESSFTATSQNCQLNTDEGLFEFVRKSPSSYIEYIDTAHGPSCLDVFNCREATSSSANIPLGNNLKRRRPSDYSGCEIRNNDLLQAEDLDNQSQRSHLRRKFSFCEGFESTQCYRSLSQAVASINFDSSKTDKRQAMTASNIYSDEFHCALSARNVSADRSKGNAHDEQGSSRDNFCLDAVLPQQPFSLASVPAEYRLVITQQSMPASNSADQQQLTQIILNNPSLATDKQKKFVSKFNKISESSANQHTSATFREIYSPSNSESDLSREICSPAVSTISPENITMTDVNQKLSCQSPSPDCVGLHSCFPHSSPSLSESNFEHKLNKVLNMSNGPVSSETYKSYHGYSATDALLTFSPLSSSLGESTCAIDSIKPSQREQNCRVSPEALFLSKLQLIAENTTKCSSTVLTDGTRNTFASAAEQNTSQSLQPIFLPHSFVGAPTVHSRSELTYLVDGVFPPNAVIVSESQVPQLYTRSSLMCTGKVSSTSEVLPISFTGLSTNPVAVHTPTSNRKSSLSSFQITAAPASMNKMGENMNEMRINQVKTFSVEAAVSKSAIDSGSSGCPEQPCSLFSSGFQSSATLHNSPTEIFTRNFYQCHHKATVFDCKSSDEAQLQKQHILVCPSEVIESAEDNSWNRTDCEVFSNVGSPPKMIGPSSTLVSRSNSKDCDSSTGESEHKASTCNHYNEIDLRDSDDRAKLENQKSLQNRISEPEPPHPDSQMTCVHLFLGAPMSVKPGGNHINDNKIMYLNKGQYYRLSMGCLCVDQFPTGTAFKSVVMVLFSETDSSDDQLDSWRTWRNRQQSYKQRILDVDLKDSYGVHLDSMEELAYNATSFLWNVDQPVRVNISVNCLSTDFTNRKGVKGKPLLIQVDTYKYDQPSLPIHRAYCKIKVFCEKGAERKVRDEERKKEANKMTIKMDNNDINCHKANPGNRVDGSKVTSSFSNFIPIQDLSRIPVLFRPNDSIGLTQVTQSKSILPTPRYERRTHSREDNVDMIQKSCTDKVITSRECQKVLLYVRRCHDEAFTALMLQTPTVPALIEALQEKCNIEIQEVRTVFKKSKKGILVKLDDKTLRHYSNESTFIIDVASITSREEETASYDIILTEIDVDVL